RRDARVDHDGDVELVDRAGRDLGARDDLADAELRRALRALVVGVARGARAGGRVRRHVGGRAGRAAGLAARALELLGVLGRLDRRARLRVGQLVALRGVDVEVALDADLRLVGADGAGDDRVELRGQLRVVARLGGRLGRHAAAGGLVGRPQHLAGAVGD